MAITFEELLPLFSLHGDASISEQAPVHDKTNIVRTSEGWQVKVDWHAHGPLNFVVCGTWKITVYLEQMGGGEFSLSGNTATEPCVSAPHAYSKIMLFGAGSVPAGLYRASVVITVEGSTGVPGPIAGHEDLGLIQFYDSGI